MSPSGPLDSPSSIALDSSAGLPDSLSETGSPSETHRVRGRLAPSPTGDLHIGGAATFLVAWLAARQSTRMSERYHEPAENKREGDATLALRIEDLDTPRVREGSVDRICDDLRWLGIDWDLEVQQSSRFALYERALASLASRGFTYYCDCSRAEIARAASAPHAGEEGPIYPGTCRTFGMTPRVFRRPPCVRFAVPKGRTVRFVDLVHGPIEQRVDEAVGDFVLRRGDGVFAYQLAVVVDDADMSITQVVRGADLLLSTPRQLLLFEALGATAPSYLHTPLVLGADGERLAKRSKGVPIRDHREAGERADVLVGKLAFLLGLTDDDSPRTVNSLLDSFDPRRLSRESIRWIDAPNDLEGCPAALDR